MTRKRSCVIAALCAAAVAVGPIAASAGPPASPVLVPAGACSDQNGDLVQLHGIGLLRVGDTYWAYGQDMRDGESYHCVATYSSKDLATWTRHEDALGFDQTEQFKREMFDDPKFVVERPKVLFDERAGRFVMLFHFDNAKRNRRYVGVAVCDRPDGRFTYLGKFKPQGNFSADMGVFVDPNDGAAYLIAEDRVRDGAPEKARTVIYRLDDDYTNVRPDWRVVLPPVPTRVKYPTIESPTIVYEPTDKLYYVFGSLLTGWGPNNNVYLTTPSLTEPKWSSYRLFAEPKSDTYASQVSFVLPVRGKDATTYVFIGDRWLARHLWDSPPVILPLKLGGGVAELEWHDAWSIDLAAGTWQTERPAQRVEAESADLADGAVVIDDVESSAGRLVSIANGRARVTFAPRVTTSGTHTLEIAYRNDDPIVQAGFASNRHAVVRVDGGPSVRLSFPVTHDRANPVAKATVAIELLAGKPNVITIAADGRGPDLDALVLYGPSPGRR